MRAIQISEFGGPEVLTPVDIPPPVPEPGQVLINVSRVGVNYADTHSADNSYLAPTTLPHVPGGEVVGTTADGHRVVAMLTGSGGYAEQAVAPEALTFEDLAGALREANGGRRVDIVLEMTGGRVTDQSIRALAPLGRLAFYGMASREEPSPIELRNLLGHSSAVAGFWLPHAFRKPGLMQ